MGNYFLSGVEAISAAPTENRSGEAVTKEI